MIRYGIVGVGGFAATWVRSLEALERQGVARLAAAIVRSPEKHADEVARLRAGGCAIYPTLDEMLARARGQIDVVGLPTGIAYHAPMGIQAMEAGYDVLVEKPVAATVQEVARLREVEARTGRWCAVGYQFVYSPTIQWLKARLLSGDLGALREARVVVGWPRGTSYYARNPWAGQIRHAGGWVLDGPATNATAHHLTNMLYLAMAQRGGAAAIASVRAELYHARDIPSYDTSCVEVVLDDGARLLHCASHALDEPLEPVMDVFCERGSIRWHAEENSAIVQHADGRVERYADDDRAGLHAHPFAQVARVAAGQDPAPLCGLTEAAPHALAIDLAFESSEGVAPIPAEHTYRRQARDGSEIVCVRSMGELLREALARGLTFSGLGAPWAKQTRPASARGYDRFPRGESLRRALGLD